MNWDNLRIFLYVAKAGSFRKAAEQEDIHYTTLARQVTNLEDSLGCKLIIRSKQGLILTDEGSSIIDSLKEIEEKISILKSAIQDTDEETSGTIRINLTRLLSNKVIFPYLTEFHKLYPDIKVEIIPGNAESDLNKHEADIAIWSIANKRIPENLVGKCLGKISTYIYGTAEYIENFNPESPDTKATIIGDSDGQKYMSYLTDTYLEHIPVGLRLEGVYVKAEASSNGQGLAKLPICVANLYENLVPLRKAPCPSQPDELWVLTHPELKKVARIRVFIDFISIKLKEDHPEFWLTYE
jgi:DNA-binding transcriptional LysR family regulator